MEIPDPKANYKDKVLVHNYRSKPKDGVEIWEEGEVKGLSYQNYFGKFSWQYEILLDRHSLKGNVIWLYVSDDQIKKI